MYVNEQTYPNLGLKRTSLQDFKQHERICTFGRNQLAEAYLPIMINDIKKISAIKNVQAAQLCTIPS